MAEIKRRREPGLLLRRTRRAAGRADDRGSPAPACAEAHSPTPRPRLASTREDAPERGTRVAPFRPTRGARRTGPALLLLLGACAAAGPPGVTGDAYASLQQALRADPGARAAFTRRCTEGRAAEPQAARELTARMLGVGPDQVDRVFCERETAAIARGAIGYEDFSALTAHRADAAAAARVLDALTAPASPSTVAA